MVLRGERSGFSADASSFITQGDRERLVSYLPMLSPGRMEYVAGASQVIYHGKNEGAPGWGILAP